MGRDNRSHAKLVASAHRTFKAHSDFFNSFWDGFSAENYCGAGRFGSPGTDLSDAIVAAGTFISRLTETSLPSAAASPAGFCGAVAIGTDGAVVAAVVAANASASP